MGLLYYACASTSTAWLLSLTKHALCGHHAKCTDMRRQSAYVYTDDSGLGVNVSADKNTWTGVAAETAGTKFLGITAIALSPR